jgi:hypothetical protein
MGKGKEGYELEGDVLVSNPVSQDTQVMKGEEIPFKNRVRVSLWEATHCNKASALQTRFDAAAVN